MDIGGFPAIKWAASVVIPNKGWPCLNRTLKPPEQSCAPPVCCAAVMRKINPARAARFIMPLRLWVARHCIAWSDMIQLGRLLEKDNSEKRRSCGFMTKRFNIKAPRERVQKYEKHPRAILMPCKYYKWYRSRFLYIWELFCTHAFDTRGVKLGSDRWITEKLKAKNSLSRIPIMPLRSFQWTL